MQDTPWDTAARPPRAQPPPLIRRLPEPSRRQPRASRTQSGGIAREKLRQGGRSRGQACTAPLPPRAPVGPGPRARPAPARVSQSSASSQNICINPAPGFPGPRGAQDTNPSPSDLPRPLTEAPTVCRGWSGAFRASLA